MNRSNKKQCRLCQLKKLPNKKTHQALADATQGKNLVPAKNIIELFQKLGI